MASKRTRRLLTNVCMLLVPVGALKLAALYSSMGPAPASAEAGATTAQPQVLAAKNKPIVFSADERRKQSEAAAYAQRSRALAFGPSPFYDEPDHQDVVVTPDQPHVVPNVPDAPTFIVQVIMASDDETKALIDGKMYHVGDEFRDGWIVTEINSFARTVTIADPVTARAVTQAVKLKGERP